MDEFSNFPNHSIRVATSNVTRPCSERRRCCPLCNAIHPELCIVANTLFRYCRWCMFHLALSPQMPDAYMLGRHRGGKMHTPAKTSKLAESNRADQFIPVRK